MIDEADTTAASGAWERFFEAVDRTNDSEEIARAQRELNDALGIVDEPPSPRPGTHVPVEVAELVDAVNNDPDRRYSLLPAEYSTDPLWPFDSLEGLAGVTTRRDVKTADAQMKLIRAHVVQAKDAPWAARHRERSKVGSQAKHREALRRHALWLAWAYKRIDNGGKLTDVAREVFTLLSGEPGTAPREFRTNYQPPSQDAVIKTLARYRKKYPTIEALIAAYAATSPARP